MELAQLLMRNESCPNRALYCGKYGVFNIGETVKVSCFIIVSVRRFLHHGIPSYEFITTPPYDKVLNMLCT